MEKECKNKAIFKYLNPSDNQKLSNLSGFDLMDFLILIMDTDLELRNKIDISEFITFGLEIEVEDINNSNFKKIQKEMDILNKEWIMHLDASLRNGREFVSPVLKDTENNWKDVKNMCIILSKYAKILANAGGHVHVGSHILGNDKKSWLNFIKLWSAYENVIFRFGYGNFLTARPNIRRYADLVANEFWRAYEKILRADYYDLDDVLYNVSNKRYQAVNFNNVDLDECTKYQKYNTIEFRSPNGTLDEVVWQNNVNLFVKLLNYAKSKNFDDSKIEKRHDLNLDKYSKLEFYDEIFLEQALELCDMIFKNNMDKVYFLKQYLKQFQVRNENIEYLKTFQLIKK